jgi:16S rRNA (cytosine967-C5)-methyltransferase
MPSRSAPAVRHADPVRLAAVRAYAAFREGGVFRSTAPVSLRDAQQRRLYANLLRGMVRHSRRLEAQAARLAKRPPERLSAPVMGALVLGLYQLFDLQQADHAAVFETVELLGALGQGRAKGLVNAVLRGALRERTARAGRLASGGRELTGALPPGQTHAAMAGPPASLAERTSHPDWLVERWVRRYGAAAAERICEANNRFETSGVRVNAARAGRAELLDRLAREGVEAAPHPLLPGALLVPHLGALLDSTAFAEGLCYVQDAGSQLLGCWIAPLLSGAVLDACCAPGGKLTHLAELAQGAAAGPLRGAGGPLRGAAAAHRGGDAPLRLVGLDSSAKRLLRVRENFRRLRLDAPELAAGDARRLPFRPPGRGGGWDTILLDVPCSATGMIRKYPELKWRRNAEDLVRLGGVQGELLDAAARELLPGGRIVYVTCSLEPEENEEQVEAFLARTPRFRRRSFRDVPPPQGLGSVDDFVDAEGYLRILPDSDRMGLFAAILEPGTAAPGREDSVDAPRAAAPEARRED